MSRNNKKSRTKQQKKLVRLRRVKENVSLEDLYFYKVLPSFRWRSGADYMFSAVNVESTKRRGLKLLPISKLRWLINEYKGPIQSFDTKEVYDNLEELRMKILIIKIADIK